MPDRLRLLRRAALLALIPLLGGGAGGVSLADGSAGQSITNQASASHVRPAGGAENTLSNPIALAVDPVSGISVTPDDTVVTGFVPPGAEVVRRFTVTNLANRDDRFRIPSATVSPPAALTGLFPSIKRISRPRTGVKKLISRRQDPLQVS